MVFPYGDITVLGSVSSGAEVVAAGSIHVYGTLRGRAMAGAMGNNGKARVFCSRNEAELIAIDGYYVTAEDMAPELRGRRSPVLAQRPGLADCGIGLMGQEIKMAKVLVVTSGKGGVGKTTTTAALGAALAQAGQKVVVVDFDVGLRNLDLVMGAERRVVFDLINVVQGAAKLSQALIRDKRIETL